MRAVIVLSLIVVADACTFPDVDYADGGAGAAGGGGAGSSSSSSSSASSTSSSSSGSTMCFVPSTCVTDAMTCADTATTNYTSCAQKCNSNQQCINGCQKTQQTELGKCAAACENCAGCKPNNCRALVGL